MKHGIQKKLAEETGISTAFLNQILAGIRRPSWNTAKKLARTTRTNPILWVEGNQEEIKKALEKI